MEAINGQEGEEMRNEVNSNRAKEKMGIQKEEI